MKNKLLRTLALMLSFSTIVGNSLSVFAYEIPVDENGNSVEKIEYKSSDDERFNGKTNVYAELASIYKVTIPKVVVLSGESKDARYFVKVEGDIAGYEQINVIPDENFLLYSKNKDSQTATINQDKIVWQVADFDTDAIGTITAKDITAGKWQGTFNFNVNLSQVAGAIELPEHVQTEPVRENEIDATCTKNGSYDEVVYCLDCDEELSRITKTVPKLGHVSGETIKTVIKEPTCTEKGSHTETTYCSRCGEVISERTVSDYELGHEIENGKCTRCELSSGFYGTKNGEEVYISWSELVSKYGLNIEKDCTKTNDISLMNKYSMQYIERSNNLVGDLIIDDSVKTLGSYNVNPSTIKSITIGAKTDLSKNGSLMGTYENIYISKNNPYYTSVEGVAFTKDMKTLIKYPNLRIETSYVIPEGVEIVKDRAFQNTNLKQIAMPNTVKTLKHYAFYGSKITSAIVPDSVTYMDMPFFNCSDLTQVTYRGVVYTTQESLNNKVKADDVSNDIVWYY